MRWDEKENGVLESRLNGVMIDRLKDENAGYPTLCKGRFHVGDDLLPRAGRTHQFKYFGITA